MAEPFLGEIRMFGFNFSPRGWALCNGQLMPINQNSALFALVGTLYGGDGRTTFALPDLRGRNAIHFGESPGLPNRQIGSKGGAATHTLTAPNLPPHAHELRIPCNNSGADSDNPQNHFPGAAGEDLYASNRTPDVTMAAMSTESTGTGQAFSAMDPFLTLNFSIALQGVFPSRS